MKSRIALVSVAIFVLSGCAASNPAELSDDILVACNLLEKPDSYRAGILVVISARSNPDVIAAGKGDPLSYIDGVIRKSQYPGVIDGTEATAIRERFAEALDAYAGAYMLDIKEIRSIASARLDEIAQELRDRCTSLGYEYEGEWNK